jgi:arsenite-transporting ATPase
LLIFGGKGGVGKTSCAAAAALRYAALRPGESVLLVSIDPAHSLADSLAGLVPPANLAVLELDAKACLDQFREKNGAFLRRIAAAGTYFDDQDIDRLLNLSLPGADELMAFIEISAWVERRSYDRIIVDTAPSGHTLRLLEIPRFLKQWIGMLNALVAKRRYMRKVFNKAARADDLDGFISQWTASVERLDALIRVESRCRFVPVATADSAGEAIAFLEKLRALRIPVRDIVVNQLRPVHDDCALCSHIAAGERRCLAPLQALAAERQYSLWGIPLQSEEVRGGEMLATLLSAMAPLPTASPQPEAQTASVPTGAEGAGRPAGGLRLALFSGKGGVGKTTLACAAALWFAREFPERRTLLLSTDPADSLSRCLGVPAGAEPVAVCRGLDAMDIDANQELAVLKDNYVADLRRMGSSPNIDLAFDRVVLEHMIHLAPSGLDELMALIRIVELLANGRYDTVVVASASTGHFTRLLELPELVDQWLKTFFSLLLKYEAVFQLPQFTGDLIRLSRNLKSFRALLKDPARSALYAVAIPTQMALDETRDLLAACQSAGVAVPVIFVNMLTPPADCSFCAALRGREKAILDQFSEWCGGCRLARVDRRIGMVGIEALESLGQQLFGSSVPAWSNYA